MMATNLATRFRGCLMGGLIGDCCGAPFESEFPISKSVLTKFLRNLLVDKDKGFQILPYTDDTAMTRCVAESLATCKGFEAKDMAKRFTLEFYRQPRRGYGGSVIDVFANLNSNDFEEPYKPATLQFGGRGSFGNGGSMRVAPVALYGFHLDDDQVVELAKNCTRITHSNREGYNGAILQCLAVHEALKTPAFNNQVTFDEVKFIDTLLEKMEKVENSDAKILRNNESLTPYTDKLRTVKTLLNKTSDVSIDEIVALLGNSVSAFKSVPTAIYSVIKAHKPNIEFETDNIMMRTLYQTISLGGDTDTIASMACSIVGAMYGEEIIPEILFRHCEEKEKVIELSDNLYALQQA